ncbi:MAG TPA: GNAT family N-acetyltransferase [Sphingomicrobium sp.]|nr:GNAT family N-acetyltransferase [Sphingomicrobium sp.]
MIRFRDAAPDDSATLAELGARTFTETFGHLYSPENLAAFLVNHSIDNWRRELGDTAFAVRIGEADGQAVAYAKLGPPSLPFEPRGNPIELRQIYVLKPWQGKGAAAEMMDWVLGEARRRGADELYLSVFTDNHRARRFYARYGFEEIGPYAFMVGSHADEDIVMRLGL